MKYLFLALGILCFGSSLYLMIHTLRQFCPAHKLTSIDKKTGTNLGLAIALSGLSGLCLQLSINLWTAWGLNGGQVALSLLGASLFLLCFGAFWVVFVLKHYKPNLEDKQRKIVRVMDIVLPILSIVFFLMLGEGVAPFLTYPLVSGFAIDGTGFHWVNYLSSYGGFHIAWYALCILLGAYLAYLVSDHKIYEVYGKHGLIENLFVFSLICGILGARIWYVVGNFGGDQSGVNFARDIEKGEWYSMFQIWQGGLTILGGAAGGIIFGILYLTKKRKYMDVLSTLDLIVPTIFLGQIFGRWGNFFNHEVYGAATSMNDWMFLPTWIRCQMAVSYSNGLPAGDSMYVPLFLIEGTVNLIGFFLLSYLLPKVWKKGRAPGDLVGLYLVWYGIVRIIMEPLRNETFNMGSNGKWSIWNSLIYILVGLFLILCFHLYAYFEKKHPSADPTRNNQFFYFFFEVGMIGMGLWWIIDGFIKRTGDYPKAYTFAIVMGFVLAIAGALLFYGSLHKFLHWEEIKKEKAEKEAAEASVSEDAGKPNGDNKD